MPTMTRKNSKIPDQRMAERDALLATLGEKVALLSSSVGEWLAYPRFMASLHLSRRWVGR
jgi:hypothetical protein